jgi:hypothetical protein
VHLKSEPVLLRGGFKAWTDFVNSTGLRWNDWVGIGDGPGGEVKAESVSVGPPPRHESRSNIVS